MPRVLNGACIVVGVGERLGAGLARRFAESYKIALIARSPEVICSTAAQINWNAGNNNWMTYITGGIPAGAYQSTRLANIGIGHTAIDGGAGYTYLNETNGRELSAVLGFTYNGQNTHTNYQSGWDMHLDWAISQFLSNHFNVGIVGYYYHQLSPDSGTGNRVGSFESSVASVGGEAGYSFNMLGKQASLNVRGYWEFSAQHRPSGAAAFVQILLPLTPSKNTSH